MLSSGICPTFTCSQHFSDFFLIFFIGVFELRSYCTSRLHVCQESVSVLGIKSTCSPAKLRSKLKGAMQRQHSYTHMYKCTHSHKVCRFAQNPLDPHSCKSSYHFHLLTEKNLLLYLCDGQVMNWQLSLQATDRHSDNIRGREWFDPHVSSSERDF